MGRLDRELRKHIFGTARTMHQLILTEGTPRLLLMLYLHVPIVRKCGTSPLEWGQALYTNDITPANISAQLEDAGFNRQFGLAGWVAVMQDGTVKQKIAASCLTDRRFLGDIGEILNDHSDAFINFDREELDILIDSKRAYRGQL